jgi:hypothetical protein
MRAERFAFVILAFTATGCSLFHRERPPVVDVAAPAPIIDSTTVMMPDPPPPSPVKTKGASSSKKNGTADKESTARPAPPPAPADTLVAAPAPAPDLVDSSHRPVISMVLTEEQKTEKAEQYRTDTVRANMALDSLRGRTLNERQADQKASAERFLAESKTAFDGNDLPRACSLAEKARVIAEELKSSSSPH